MNEPHYLQPLLPTPFHSRTQAACCTALWSGWAGYQSARCYTHVEFEYFAARNQATLFDLSPMIKYRIAGSDSLPYLNRLMTRDVGKLAVGRVAYTVWCNDVGKVLDDGTLFRLDDNEYLLCAQDRHLPWLQDSAIGFDLEVEDVSERFAALALQGPTSYAIVQRMGFDDLMSLRPFGWRRVKYRGAELIVSRTGFSGDLGYEIWSAPDQAESLWDDLMAAGADFGLMPMGSDALELLRIEAGYLLPNADFMPADHATRASRGRSPFELGLGWLVDFNKGHFVGRRALQAERAGSGRYTFVGLDIDGNKPAHESLIYHRRRELIGHVTSAMWSPTCKRNIAIAELQAGREAMLDDLWVEIYLKKELKWEKLMVRCRVVPRPFFDPPRRLATPPAAY
ncbi:MAG: aminomethyltransferase family protein [Gammaproteobacteria bacterium]|nr:aminomethyltransferase family protein [Gammaproteobacteria bacterium]MDH3464561.1 aminomethyltransferase family protein [Gammaproteobacteria bacterium]